MGQIHKYRLRFFFWDIEFSVKKTLPVWRIFYREWIWENKDKKIGRTEIDWIDVETLTPPTYLNAEDTVKEVKHFDNNRQFYGIMLIAKIA